MLTAEELSFVCKRAYIPEHLPHYVEPTSGAEAHLVGDCLCYLRDDHLNFVGYPLEGGDVPSLAEEAFKRFRPRTFSLIAPELPEGYKAEVTDHYFRIDLPLSPPPERAYMVRRAARELAVREGTFGKEHLEIVEEFLATRKPDPRYREIFERIPHYLEGSPTARLIEARKEGRLVAFTVVELGSGRFAFYLFNFRNTKVHVPGASDLLFFEMVQIAQRAGKGALNLGLGMNKGNRRFKEKWGGRPFLPYQQAEKAPSPLELEPLIAKL